MALVSPPVFAAAGRGADEMAEEATEERPLRVGTGEVDEGRREDRLESAVAMCR